MERVDEMKQTTNMSGANSRLNLIVDKAGIYLVTLLFLILGIFISPNFLTGQNIMNIVLGVSILGLVAAGMSFVTYSGHFADLSVPAIIAFSGNIAITTLRFGIVPALILGIAAGMLIGVVNGIVIGYLRAHPILWTISVQVLMEGLQRFMWGNQQIYPNREPGSPGSIFIQLFGIKVIGIPVIVMIMLLLFLIFDFILRRTSFGMQIRLIGSSYDVAKYSGVNTKKIVFSCFLISSFTSAIAGIFMSSMNQLGAFYLGEGYDFRTVTAIVIGGIALTGGRGSMAGVFGGVLTMGLLVNILTFLSMKFYQQIIITGLIFIAVVWFNTWQARKMGRDDE